MKSSSWNSKSKLAYLLQLNYFVLLIFALGVVGTEPPVKLKSSKTQCGRKFKIVNAADVTTLRFAQVIFRHGDRTPLDSYPNDPYKYPQYWQEGEGQLTKYGKQMAYGLGQYLRWRYDIFLSPAYSQNEVHAISSDLDRTIMTALTALAGLYPTDNFYGGQWSTDINWQPIPVHTIPFPHDNKIAYYYHMCPRYQELLYEVGNSTMIKQIDADNADLYAYLEKHTGISPFLDWRQVSWLYDTLYIETLYNLELPSWTRNVYPNRMKPLLLLPFQLLTYTEEMKRLRGGPLLTEMISNMELTMYQLMAQAGHPAPLKPLTHSEIKDRLQKFKNAKLYMYSGHDTTITAILGTMNLFDFSHVPPYVSMVMLELHQDPNDNDYFVRLFYRNQTNGAPPIELNIPGCIDDCDSDQVCTFRKFKQLMQFAHVTNFEEECKLVQSSIITSTNTETEPWLVSQHSQEMHEATMLSSVFSKILEFGGQVGRELYWLFIEPFVDFYIFMLERFH